MADVGYFDSVSANLKTGIRSAGQGGAERLRPTPRPACPRSSTPSTRGGVKAAAAISGLADGLTEAVMLPLLGAMGIKGMACLI